MNLTTGATDARVGTAQATIALQTANQATFWTYLPITISRAITGAIALVKKGLGVLTLSGTNTYSGNAAIDEGIVSITSTASLPGYNTNGRYSVAPAATLAVYNAVTDAEILAIRGTTNFQALSRLGFDTTSGNRTYTPAISNTSQGALGLVKLGANQLTLGGVSTYTGPTIVLAGTLATNAANLIPDASAITIASGATLQLGGDETIATLDGAGTLTTANALAFSSNNSAVFSGTITSTLATNAAFYRYGTGSQTLSGTVTLSAVFRHDNGTIIISGGTFTQTIPGGATRSYQLAIGAANTAALTVSGGSMTLAGMMLGENAGGTSTVNITGGALTINGELWFAGQSNTMTLSSGSVTVASGTDIAGGSTANTSVLNINGGTFRANGNINWGRGADAAQTATINLNGGVFYSTNHGYTRGVCLFNFNGGVFSFTTTGITINLTGVTWRVKSGGAIFDVPSGYSETFSNNLLTDATSTGGGFIKQGPGTLTFGGTASTYTGQCQILDGVLSVASLNNNSANGVFGNNTSAIILGSNGKTATLRYTAAADVITTKGIILPSGAIGVLDITGNANNYWQTNGAITGAGSLVKTGIGFMAPAGNNTYSGGTTLNQGLTGIGSNTALGTGTIVFNGGSMRSFLSSVDRTLSNSISFNTDTLFPNGVNESSLTLSGQTTLYATIILTVNIGASISSKLLNLAGQIGDGGNGYGLTKAGTGNLILSGNNTYTGNTTITAGNLRILYLPIGEIRFSGTSGVLQFAANITTDLSSRIKNNTVSVRIDTNGQNITFTSLDTTNSGGLLKSGTGTLTLSGSGNAIRGALQCTAGTLAFTGAFTTASRISASDSAGNSGVISISGTLTQSGGTFTVRSFQISSGNNTSVGTCNILPGANVTLGLGAMLGDNGSGGVAGGTGTFNQSGGTFNANGEFWTAGGTSNVNISGGSFTSARFYIGGGGNSNSASTSTLTVSGGTATVTTYDFGIGSTNATTITNLDGGTFSCTDFFYRQGTSHTINCNGGTLLFRATSSVSAVIAFVVKSGGAILDIASGQTQTINSVLSAGAGSSGGLTKNGAGTLVLTATNTYTGTTTINAGTLRVAKTSGGITGTASFTSTSLTVDFAGVTPTSGATYQFLPGATSPNTLTVSLTNAGGKTGTYNFTTSTLTIN